MTNPTRRLRPVPRWVLAISLIGVVAMLLVVGVPYVRAHNRPFQTWQFESTGSSALSADGTLLAVASGPEILVRYSETHSGTELMSKVHVFRVEDGHRLYTFDAPGMAALAFSPDSQLLAAGGMNGPWLWRMDDGTLLPQWSQDAEISDIAFSPDGQFLATGESRVRVRIWRVSDGALLHTLQNEFGVSRLAFSPDGQMLLTTGGRDYTALWRVRDGRLIHKIPGGQTTALAYSPAEDLVAIASSQTRFANGQIDAHGEIAFWRVAADDVELVHAVPVEEHVWSMTFSPDGQMLAMSGFRPRTVHEWVPSFEGVQDWLKRRKSPVYLRRVSDGPVVRVLRSADSSKGTLHFTPDGKTLIASGGAVDFWRIK
jgi:WD40 repeat protein